MVEVKAPSVGVGRTALFVAWMRQSESRRPDALFHDPLAERMLEVLADDPALAGVRELIETADRTAAGHPEYFAVRTRFFDDEILAASDTGIRQIVTLAAGVDGRTTRLELPAGTRWFEVDLPEMTQFKDALLAASGLPSTCERVAVAADLREDWQSSLREAGFDPGLPTAWLIEGLLMYLPAAAGDALIEGVGELSAPGSRLMLEHLQASMLAEEGREVREYLQQQGAAWHSARDDIAGWLGSHGWTARVHAGTEPEIGHGRAVAPIPAGWLATARRTADKDGGGDGDGQAQAR